MPQRSPGLTTSPTSICTRPRHWCDRRRSPQFSWPRLASRALRHSISTLNAFITVTAESALAQARQAEAEVQSGKWRGPLHGIPDCSEGLDRHRWRAHHWRERAVQGSYSTRRCRHRSAASRQRGRPPRQVEHERSGLRTDDEGDKRLRSRLESMGDREDFRGIVERSGSGRRRRPLFRRDRHRHRRFNSTTRRILRSRRSDAQLRTRKHTGAIPLSRSADYLGPMTRSVVDAAICYGPSQDTTPGGHQQRHAGPGLCRRVAALIVARAHAHRSGSD